MGEDKTVSVIAVRSLGETAIELETDPEGVIELLDSSPIELVEHPRREDCLIARVHIRPLIEDEETFLTVRCGPAEAIASVEVRPEREFPDPVPPIELEFEREKYQLAHTRRRSLVLRAPVEVINDADTTNVRVTSSDAGIVVLGESVKLEFDENELCFIGRAQVDPRVLGARGALRRRSARARQFGGCRHAARRGRPSHRDQDRRRSTGSLSRLRGACRRDNDDQDPGRTLRDQEIPRPWA